MCGCILRFLCCAIITDGCRLGPTERNPNGDIFWKGCDHQNPKKVLHPSVCLSVFFNDALWKYLVQIGTICFLFPTHSWTPSSASLYYFVRLKDFSLERCNPREQFLCHLPTRKPLVIPAFGKECRYRLEWGGDVNGRLEQWPLRRAPPPNELGRTRVAFSMSLKMCSGLPAI